jgi:hypothetical protein
MPTHRDMPAAWQEHARRQATTVDRARELRALQAPKSLAELARERRARLAAADAARALTSAPPPSGPSAA